MQLPQPAIDYVTLKHSLEGQSDEQALHKAIVNTPFSHRLATLQMFLGIVVLLLVDKKTGKINRVALSDTELAKNTTDVSAVPFEEIKIDVTHPTNVIAKAIRLGEPQSVADWQYLFEPALTPAQARINQASAGIAYSAVYPFSAGDGGALIYSYYEYGHNIGEAQQSFMRQYTTLVNGQLAAFRT